MWKLIFILLLVTLLLLSACAPGSGRYREDHKANIFNGIWHGWIAPITLIWGFFDRSIRVYEVNNTGWGYDFGFYMAILGGFGGFALTRKKRHKDD
jgi:hypothetical protein